MFSQDFIERFWSNVKVVENACWKWQGHKDSNGYGIIKNHQKALRAHRVSLEMATGQSLGHFCVLHKCDNPACVNPDHLYPGTPADNAHDRSSRGRSGNIRGERNGRAKLNQEQVNEIRRLYRETTISKVKLGKLFNVTDVQIGLIIRNEEWRQ